MNSERCTNMKMRSEMFDDWYRLVCQTDLPNTGAYLELMLINVLPGDMQVTVHNLLKYDRHRRECFEFANDQCGLIKSKEIAEHESANNVHSLVRQSEQRLQQPAEHGDNNYASVMQQMAPGSGRQPPPPPRPSGPRPARSHRPTSRALFESTNTFTWWSPASRSHGEGHDFRKLLALWQAQSLQGRV